MSSEAEDREERTPQSSPETPMPQQPGAMAYDESHCPLCGGAVRREWGSVCLCAFIMFFVCAPIMMAPLAMHSQAGVILFLVLAGLAIVSLVAIPLTGALAVASRSRCRVCGHRFWPSGGTDDARFPVRLGLVGWAILSVSLGVGTALVVTAPGWGVMDVALMMIGRIILAGLALGVGLLAQAILWRRLRARMAGLARFRFILLLPAIVISILWLSLATHDHTALVHEYDPLVRAPHVLARLQLASLPESARNVRVYIYRVFLAGEDFLRFEADPNDIERFLADSPSLNNITAHTSWSEKMRTTSYYNSSAPSWYDQPVQGRSRRYDLNTPGGIAELIVDDERHAVYVYWGK